VDHTHSGLDLFWTRYVADERRRRNSSSLKVRYNLISPTLIKVHDGYRRALVSQPMRDRFPNVSASAGDYRNLPLVTHF
jgi:hypothetical protein